MLLVIVLLAFSSIWKRWAIVQPILFLVVWILPVSTDHDSVYGLGIFVSGVFLLYKGGYLDTFRKVKFFLLILYLYGVELYFAVYKNGFVPSAFSAVFFITVFLVFMYLMFKDQVIVYLKEKKPELSLSGSGLSEAEAAYVRELALGKSHKEIAADAGVSESTVRNTLARAYKKLQVTDKTALMAVLTAHEVVD